jgi:hypothetical protein
MEQAKRGRGQPKKLVTRSERIMIRLTTAEKALLLEEALSKGYDSLNEYIVHEKLYFKRYRGSTKA